MLHLQQEGASPIVVEEARAQQTDLKETIDFLQHNPSWTSNVDLLEAAMDLQDAQVAIELRASHIEAIEAVLQQRHVGARTFKWRAVPWEGLGLDSGLRLI